MSDQQTVNLSAGDELVLGPTAAAATVEYAITTHGKDDFRVRDAIAHRDQIIERQRERIATLENVEQRETAALAEAVADALLTKLSDRLMWPGER